MLAYFPVPYKDELLYSCIARYAMHTGQINNHKAVIQDVFASKTAVAIPDLPSHLNKLVHQLRFVWPTSTEELISHHTLAPIYFPFLSSCQVKKIRNSMTSEKGGNIHSRAGITASSIRSPSFFRYCPECFKSQQDKLGEVYWTRAHQLPGVGFCIHHSCHLKDTSLHFHPKNKHYYHPAAAENNTSISKSVLSTTQEYRLIEMYTELLTEPCLNGLGPNRWTLFYQSLASELGFMRKRRVEHRQIYLFLKMTWTRTSLEKYLGVWTRSLKLESTFSV